MGDMEEGRSWYGTGTMVIKEIEPVMTLQIVHKRNQEGTIMSYGVKSLISHCSLHGHIGRGLN